MTHSILVEPMRRYSGIEFYPQEGLPTAEWIVPEGQYFVMGDNRGESFDSRNMGAIPCEDLKGKVFFRLFPLGRIR